MTDVRLLDSSYGLMVAPITNLERIDNCNFNNKSKSVLNLLKSFRFLPVVLMNAEI